MESTGRREIRKKKLRENEKACIPDAVSNKKTTSIYFSADCKEMSVTVPSKKAKLETAKEQLESERSAKINHSAPVMSSKLDMTFYDSPTEELAKKLLGKLLYRVLENGEVVCGRIVETEGYLGEIDKACHAYGGKRTQRCEPMYMKPGTAYVYIIYGMYHCLNISSREPGACVLIRALEPLQGLESMKKFRGTRRKDNGSKLKDFQLSNGPSKLCQALCIEKANLNKEDMVKSSRFWVEDDKDQNTEAITVVTSTRIGIDSYGPEWALKPLRFYILGNKCVSVRDKNAEIRYNN